MRFYSVKSKGTADTLACRLLKNDQVIAYLAKKELEAEKKADYTQEQWVADAIRLKEMCMADRDVTVYAETIDDDGKVQRVELAKRVFEPTTAKSTLEMLGKFKKYLAPDTAGGPTQPGVNVTNGGIFVGADGFGGVVGQDGKYIQKPKRVDDDE